MPRVATVAAQARAAGLTVRVELLLEDSPYWEVARGAARLAMGCEMGDESDIVDAPSPARRLLGGLMQRHRALVVHCARDTYDVYIGRACRGAPAGASGGPP